MSSDYKSLKEEHNLFSWSKPVGYDFKEVEATIARYEEILNEARNSLANVVESNKLLVSSMEAKDQEILQARMEVESIKAPLYSDEEALNIMENFNTPQKLDNKPINSQQNQSQDIPSQTEVQQQQQQQQQHVPEPKDVYQPEVNKTNIKNNNDNSSLECTNRSNAPKKTIG